MKRVLIVDDDADIRDSLAMLLADRYRVVTAADGREALAVVQDGGADVVLLDLMMPVMSGEELVRELRRRGCAVPVALISAARDLPGIARQLGVGDYIVKPFDLPALERLIARLVADDEPPPSTGLSGAGAGVGGGAGGGPEPQARAHRLQVGSPPQSSSPQSIF